MPKVLNVDPLRPDRESLEEASEVLRRGGLVAFPTETVYGLGADAMNPRAVEKIYRAKGRPADNPLIVHIGSIEMLYTVAEDPGEDVVDVLRRAWPGPFTVILRKRREVPMEVTAGLSVVAVRMPAHPVALGLIESLGGPVAAPSANKSGRPSPTRAEHVLEDLGDSVDLVLDGGETFFGVESTIVDLTADPPTILRPGPVDPDQIEKLLGRRVSVPSLARGFSEAVRPLAPGMKYRHYAPERPLVLVDGDCDVARCAEIVLLLIKEAGLSPCLVACDEILHVGAGLGVPVIGMGSAASLVSVARNLFSSLRLVDKLAGVDVCAVVGVEERGIGLAIMNRLRKASGGNAVDCCNLLSGDREDLLKILGMLAAPRRAV